MENSKIKKIIVFISFTLSLFVFASLSAFGEKNPIRTKDEFDAKSYFPIKKNNYWKYKRTIMLNRDPLFSLRIVVEKSFSDYEKGDSLWITGRNSEVKSGFEKFSVSGYDETWDAYNVKFSRGGLGDWRHSQKLYGMKSVSWRFLNDTVWEKVIANEYGDGTVRVSGYLALLSPGVALEEMTSNRKRKIISELSKEEIQVPAGTFSNCLKNVMTEIGMGEKPIKTVSFFCRNTGLVKQIQYDSKERKTYSLELTEFKVTSI